MEALEKYSENLREESGFKELFLTKSMKLGGEIVAYKSTRFGEIKLKSFIKRWDIRDEEGKLYPLKSYQFRENFIKELVKKMFQ